MYFKLCIFDTFRYLTHLKWAEGCVETEDVLLPYPKRVKSSATDATLTLPVPSRTGIFASAEAKENSPAISTQSTVSRELIEEHDAWAVCDTEQGEAFWRCSSIGSSGAVTRCSEGGGNDAGAASEANESKTSCRQLATQTCCDVDERTCNEHVTGRAVDIADTLSVIAQDIDDRHVTDRVSEDVSAACNIDDTQRCTELASHNADEIVSDNTFVAPANSVSEANISSTAEYICCDYTNCDVQHTTDSSHCEPGLRLRDGISAEDYINVDMASERDISADDIVIDERCVDNDSDADACILDDTDDSDVDESLTASRPLWQTVMKKDPYPLKEHLLLTLEEVNSFTLLYSALSACTKALPAT